MTRTMTPPIPNRLATRGRRQPSPPPPKPPPPSPPLRPVTSSKLVLSRSSPKRMLVSLPVAQCFACVTVAIERTACLAPLRGGVHDSGRKGGAGHRLDVGHRARNRKGARCRRRQANDQWLRRC